MHMDNQANVDSTVKDLRDRIENNKNVSDVNVNILYDNLLYLKALLRVTIPEHVDISNLSHLIGLAGDIVESSIVTIENVKFGDNERKSFIPYEKMKN